MVKCSGVRGRKQVFEMRLGVEGVGQTYAKVQIRLPSDHQELS